MPAFRHLVSKSVYIKYSASHGEVWRYLHKDLSGGNPGVKDGAATWTRDEAQELLPILKTGYPGLIYEMEAAD